MNQLTAVDEILNKFRSILCEIMPTVCEDSGMAEWSQGELDRAFHALQPVFKLFAEREKAELNQILEPMRRYALTHGLSPMAHAIVLKNDIERLTKERNRFYDSINNLCVEKADLKAEVSRLREALIASNGFIKILGRNNPSTAIDEQLEINEKALHPGNVLHDKAMNPLPKKGKAICFSLGVTRSLKSLIVYVDGKNGIYQIRQTKTII